jgi:hypothetical protein
MIGRGMVSRQLSDLAYPVGSLFLLNRFPSPYQPILGLSVFLAGAHDSW